MVDPTPVLVQHISEETSDVFGDSPEGPTDSLTAARSLIDAGLPVFVARRNPGYDPTDKKSAEFFPPNQWQETPPDPSLLDVWKPGDALCLVTGHGLDAVDCDPRNGADPAAIRAALDTLGVQILGTVKTPGGGAHYYVRSTGITKSANISRGVDYQGRGLDGTGTAFVYLPGTARPKYQNRGYVWTTPVQVEELHDIGEDSRAEQVDSVAAFLAGLGTKVRTRAENSATLTGAEPLDTMPDKLRDLLADLGPWTLRNGEPASRSHRFHHLVAECRRSGLTQGQTVTALDPWCHGVGKYVGRVAYAVTGSWSKVQNLTDWEPEAEQTKPKESEEETPSTWEPLDLGPILDGTYVQEVPAFLPREDGVCLLYAGRLHSFHGESESGKSLLAQVESARLLNLGQRVLWVDFESDPSQVVAMLRTFGADTGAIRERFTYVRPDTGLGSDKAREAFARILSQRYVLAVVDGVTEALALLTSSGGTPEEQVVHYMRRLPKRLAQETRAAVVQIDHVTKSKDARGRNAIGSQHKLNTLDGAAYVVEVSKPLGRGMRGEIVLRLAKDRPGYLRGNSGTWRASDRTQEAARITVDSTGTGPSVVTVSAPATRIGEEGSAQPFRPTVLMQRVSEYLETVPEPVSVRNVRDNVTGNAQHLGTALDRLCTEGFVERVLGQGGTTLHKYKSPYREATDAWTELAEFHSRAVPVSPLRGGEPGNHYREEGETGEKEPLRNHSGTAGTQGTGENHLGTTQEEEGETGRGTTEEPPLDLWTKEDPW